MIRWGMEGRRLPAQLLAIADTCWFCHAPLRAIVGVLVEPGLTADRSGFVALDDVAGALAYVIDPRVLGACQIGELRHRASPGVQGGYVANGCPKCDALIGRFRVEDLVREHLIAGGTLAELTLGVTIDLLTSPQGSLERTDLARVTANAPLRRASTRPAA
jgi:hypothetical protein